MKRITPIWICLIPMLVSGCYSARYIQFDGLKPSEVNIPPAIRSLAVVSRCDLDSTYKMAQMAARQMDRFNLDSLLAKQLVFGCCDALLESPRFDLFNPVIHRDLVGDYSNPSVMIPWDRVNRVAGDPPQDAVLSLEKASVNDSLIHSVIDSWFSVYEYRVIVKSSWRLYRLSNFQSNPYAFTDTLTYSIDLPYEFLAKASIRIDYMKDAMYEIGSRTARKLAPWWTTLDRYYFKLGSINQSYTAAESLKNDQWQIAAETWRPFTESKRKITASKACFNMALTCELAGNIPAALEWLQKSENLGMLEYYVSNYRRVLATRKAETAKLDEQMK